MKKVCSKEIVRIANIMEGKTKFFKFSFNTAMSKIRGSCAVMAKLVLPSIVEAEKLPEIGEVSTTYWASIVGNPEENRQSIEISTEALDSEVERTIGTKILSTKAKTRAEQGTSAGVLDSVKSELEQTGAVNTTLREGRFKKIVAPVKKEDSNESFKKEIKARIPNQRVEEGRGQ